MLPLVPEQMFPYLHFEKKKYVAEKTKNKQTNAYNFSL